MGDLQMSQILRYKSERKLIPAKTHNTSLENQAVFCVYPSQISGCSQRCGGDVTLERARWFFKMLEYRM